MIAALYPAGAFLVLALLFVCPLKYRGNGRHVSRPLGRVARLDRLGVFGAQTLWIIGVAGAALIIGHALPVLAGQWLLVVWLIDDALTGGKDDEPRRKHNPFKVRLRMPARVFLRPVERVPAPA